MDGNDGIKKNLIEIKPEKTLKVEFHSMKVDTFWCKQLNTFPNLAWTTLDVLVTFATNYCESAFSTLMHIKNKARNRLESGDDMRVTIANKEPR